MVKNRPLLQGRFFQSGPYHVNPTKLRALSRWENEGGKISTNLNSGAPAFKEEEQLLNYLEESVRAYRNQSSQQSDFTILPSHPEPLQNLLGKNDIGARTHVRNKFV